MFKNWQKEKATTALVDAAEDLAEKLETGKPHVRDSHAAFAQFWGAAFLVKGQELDSISQWKPAAVARFIKATEAQIAALRKQREYDSSDGLAVWLHTARAITEPRLAPAVQDIWRLLVGVGPNADAMVDDLLHDADLPPRQPRRIPQGFDTEG